MSEQLFIGLTGELVPLASDKISDAKLFGYLPASEKQISDYNLQLKYGTGGQQAIAGLEGIGRGLSLGLSTPIERALGVDPEGISGREKANPISAGVGEAVGIAAPLVSTLGGTSAVSGPALAGRVGTAAAEAARGALPAARSMSGRVLSGGVATAALESGQGIQELGTAGRILTRGAASAAGAAAEGTLYGAGRVVHEAALGDPNLTAQNIIATVGLSSAIMGTVGGAGGVLSSALKEFMPKDLGNKVASILEKTVGDRSALSDPQLSGTTGLILGAMSGKPIAAALVGLGSSMFSRPTATAMKWGAKILRGTINGEAAPIADKTAEMIAAARKEAIDWIEPIAHQTPLPTAVLSHFDRINRSISDRINRGVASITTTAPTIIKTAKGLSSLAVSGDEVDPITDSYLNKVSKIQELAQTPEHMHLALTSQTNSWHDYAPNTAQALQMTSMRAISYLSSKIPQPEKPGILAPNYSQSKDAMSKFLRYYEAVNNPMGVLKQANSGTISSEAIEALSVVHPQLLEKIRSALIEKMATQNTKLNFRTRAIGSLFMGEDLDGRLSPQAIAMASSSFLSNAMSKAPISNSTKKPKGALSSSDRMMTPMQRSANRG